MLAFLAAASRYLQRLLFSLTEAMADRAGLVTLRLFGLGLLRLCQMGYQHSALTKNNAKTPISGLFYSKYDLFGQ